MLIQQHGKYRNFLNADDATEIIKRVLPSAEVQVLDLGHRPLCEQVRLYSRALAVLTYHGATVLGNGPFLNTFSTLLEVRVASGPNHGEVVAPYNELAKSKIAAGAFDPPRAERDDHGGNILDLELGGLGTNKKELFAIGERFVTLRAGRAVYIGSNKPCRKHKFNKLCGIVLSRSALQKGFEYVARRMQARRDSDF